MEFHPLANIFPLIDGDDFAALTADIRAQGLREKIKLYDGMILDGRNRYRACLEAGVDPVFEIFSGADPIAYVVSLNLRRRMLDESQRAMVAARMANMRRGERTDVCSKFHGKLISQAEAAKLTNVSERSLRSARKVIDKGVEGLTAAVDQGRIAVSVAEKIAKFSVDDQEKLLAIPDPEMAIKKVATQKNDEARPTGIFNATELRNGQALGDIRWSQLDRLIRENAIELELLRLIRDAGVPADRNTSIREIISESEIAEYMSRALEKTQ